MASADPQKLLPFLTKAESGPAVMDCDGSPAWLARSMAEASLRSDAMSFSLAAIVCRRRLRPSPLPSAAAAASSLKIPSKLLKMAPARACVADAGRGATSVTGAAATVADGALEWDVPVPELPALVPPGDVTTVAEAPSSSS